MVMMVVVIGDGGGVVAAIRPFDALILPTATADGDVAEGPTAGPVSLAGLAEVPWLRQAVVVVVTELCV